MTGRFGIAGRDLLPARRSRRGAASARARSSDSGDRAPHAARRCVRLRAWRGSPAPAGGTSAQRAAAGSLLTPSRNRPRLAPGTFERCSRRKVRRAGEGTASGWLSTKTASCRSFCRGETPQPDFAAAGLRVDDAGDVEARLGKVGPHPGKGQGARTGGRQLALRLGRLGHLGLPDDLAVVVEHLHAEPGQPVLDPVVGAVPDDDPLDRGRLGSGRPPTTGCPRPGVRGRAGERRSRRRSCRRSPARRRRRSRCSTARPAPPRATFRRSL